MDRQPRALLIAWERASWPLLHPLLDRGEMPNLQSLLARGTMGTLAAPLPLEHDVLWASLATGRRASGHGILGSAAPQDEAGAQAPRLAQRNCPAFWDLLEGRGIKTHLINWPMSDASEKTGGACVSDTFFALSRIRKTATAADLLFPAGLAAILAPMRIEPDEVDDETLRFFVPDLDRASREHDRRLLKLARAVARVLSVQAATTWLMANRPWDVVAVRFDLLAELARWALPLAPPRLDLVGELEFELYRSVLNSACQTLDLLLETLVTMAGEAQVILVSDCGLLLGDGRPARSSRDLQAAAKWTQRDGMMIISGQGCRPDGIMRGARLLDIAPTLLAMLGVPIPPEIEGRVLGEALTESPIPVSEPFQPGWPLRSALPSPPFPDDADAAFIARTWSLLRSRLDAGQVRAALGLLDDLCRVRPAHLAALQMRFECQVLLRQVPAARETLELLLDFLWGTPQASLAQARLEYAARRFNESLRHLEQLESSAHTLPRVNLQIGLNLVKLNQSSRARLSFERELEVQPQLAEARAGLAYCCLRAGEFDAAAGHALEAVMLQPQAYYAHFVLGLAQARRGAIDDALRAFCSSVEVVPDFAPAHRCLAVLYGQNSSQLDLAGHHKEKARGARHWHWGF